MRQISHVLAILWVAAPIVVSIQVAHQHSNNFEIFRTASDRLLHHGDLYSASVRHADLFKYSPTFALLFAPFAIVPVGLGLLLWNALNAAALYFALGALLPAPEATSARAIVFLDVVGSMQNAQSNALVTALIVLTFTEFRRDRPFSAAAAMAAGTGIKIFPLGAGSFALMHRGRLRFAIASVIVGGIVLLLPLLVTSPDYLIRQYQAWRDVELVDALDRGVTVMQHMHLWLRYDGPNWPVQVAGLLTLVAPLVIRRARLFDVRFVRLYLASFLIFCVIFNHQAESTTFIIAVTGTAVWFVTVERTWWAWSLFGFVVLGTILSTSTAMPMPVQQTFVTPYALKAVPCIALWLAIQMELWSRPSIRVARM